MMPTFSFPPQCLQILGPPLQLKLGPNQWQFLPLTVWASASPHDPSMLSDSTMSDSYSLPSSLDDMHCSLVPHWTITTRKYFPKDSILMMLALSESRFSFQPQPPSIDCPRKQRFHFSGAGFSLITVNCRTTDSNSSDELPKYSL